MFKLNRKQRKLYLDLREELLNKDKLLERDGVSPFNVTHLAVVDGKVVAFDGTKIVGFGDTDATEVTAANATDQIRQRFAGETVPAVYCLFELTEPSIPSVQTYLNKLVCDKRLPFIVDFVINDIFVPPISLCVKMQHVTVAEATKMAQQMFLGSQ